jgi:very-short-patch-repair endonuclease
VREPDPCKGQHDLGAPRVRKTGSQASEEGRGSPSERLRGLRFHGAKFRRQVPFDRFVVDFYCHASKLVVEFDGRQHEWFSDYDAARTENLERFGVRVIGFTNEEARGDVDAVLAQIRAELRIGFD